MKFDWITWSIWAIGFCILVIWIIVPIRELRQLIKNRKAQQREK